MVASRLAGETGEEEELRRIHEELQRLLHSFVEVQKHDLHRERFPVTPEGLFDQIWAAVLVRDDLDQSLQAWRAMRLEAVAHDAQEAAADGVDADADVEERRLSYSRRSSHSLTTTRGP